MCQILNAKGFSAIVKKNLDPLKMYHIYYWKFDIPFAMLVLQRCEYFPIKGMLDCKSCSGQPSSAM